MPGMGKFLKDSEMYSINLLILGRCGNNLRCIISKQILQNGSLGRRGEFDLNRMAQNLANEKSTFDQVVAWCCRHQAITWANVAPDRWCIMASLNHNG